MPLVSIHNSAKLSQQKKKGSFSAPLFETTLKLSTLERVSPVEHHIEPVSAFASPVDAVAANSQVMASLISAHAQVRGIVPKDVHTDVHARRDDVPQIPFAEENPVAMELR